jgi:hypothetical protein
MAVIKAVPESVPDPKIGTARRVSAIAFPYYNLATSIVVAKTMHERAGGECDRTQLAVMLGYKGIKNGSFLTRVTAAKMFGLIEQEGDRLRVTPRGQAILSPVKDADASRARVEAFLAVPLFAKVYEEFKGQTLPPEVGLRNLLENKYKVVKDRVAPTVNIMLDSADEAGFFHTAGNRTQMVLPLSSPGSPAASRTPTPAVIVPEPMKGGGGNGGRGDDGSDMPGVHPMISGFLKTLPMLGTVVGTKRRTILVEAFKATLSAVYPEEDVAGAGRGDGAA